MTIREAMRQLDARRRYRDGHRKLQWSAVDVAAVTKLLDYIEQLEGEHPATSTLLRRRLDRRGS